MELGVALTLTWVVASAAGVTGPDASTASAPDASTASAPSLDGRPVSPVQASIHAPTRESVDELVAPSEGPPRAVGRDEVGGSSAPGSADPAARARIAASAEPPFVDYTWTWTPRAPASGPAAAPAGVSVPSAPASAPAPEQPPHPEASARRRGVFAGGSTRATTTNANPSVLLGARAGLTLGERFTIGGAVHSLAARYADPIIDARGNPLELRMAYAGVLLGWRAYAGRAVQLDLEALAGAGAGCISRGGRRAGGARCLDRVALVSVDPGVRLGFVLTRWLRLGVVGGYRLVARERWRAPNNFALSGPYVGLELDVGTFGAPRRRCGASCARGRR